MNPIGTHIDITAEDLEQGQDPRGQLFLFGLTDTAIGVKWTSRYRIGIETVSLDGVGLTKMDKARLWLKRKFGMVAPHD